MFNPGNIFLRPMTDDAGNVFIVDQDGRKVSGIKSLRVSGSYDDVTVLEIECLATKPTNTSNGAFCYINGKGK